MRNTPSRRRLTSFTPLLAGVALVLIVPQAVAGQTAAATQYERVQAQEKEALSASPPSADALRKLAKAYEAIVLRYPVSGYADNALWQAAGLLDRVHALTGSATDREAGLRYLQWLKKEYPHSPFAREAGPQAAVAQVATPAPTSSVAVRTITQTPLPRGDRITIELTGEAPYSGERVANPDRVFFDFNNSAGALALMERVKNIQTPLIKAVRIGSPAKGVTRVVLELVGAPRFSSFPLYDPFRLVIDVEPTTTSTLVSAASPAPITAPSTTPSPPPAPSPTPTLAPPIATQLPPAPATSTRAGDYSLARQLGLRIARIVIDPGHGGHDPGAQSNGVTEAELVLDVALRLEKLLSQQPGVEVVLTRRTNEFIPLEERTAIANRENADLFLSIHANAHRQSGVRGVETYFLSFAMNEEAEAVAARENATSGQTMGTLPSIVKAIALNDKLAESRELANLLQATLVRKLRAQSSGVRDLGVKKAPFVVLIGAQMPSVLTEIAFLTNRAEAGLLKQPAYRQQIAQALKDGVVRYQDSLKKTTTSVAARQREQ